MARPKHVPPPAQQHAPVRAGLVGGFLEGERAGGGGIGRSMMCTLPAGIFTIIGKGRSASDQLVRVPVHEGPVVLPQLLA
jgi:hypothetical protein